MHDASQPNTMTQTIRDDVSIRLLIVASIYYAQRAHADGDPGALDWLQSDGALWLESIGMDADRIIARWIANDCPNPGRLDIVAQHRRQENRINRDLDRRRRSQAAPATA